MWRWAARLLPLRFDVGRRRRPALLAALHKDKMQPMSFHVPRGAVSLSIFHEQQPNRRVGIIKYRLGYTATEDVQEAVHRRKGSARAERWDSSEDLRRWEESHFVVTLYTRTHTPAERFNVCRLGLTPAVQLTSLRAHCGQNSERAKRN